MTTHDEHLRGRAWADQQSEWRPVYCPMLQDLPTLNAIVLIRASGGASAVLAGARRQSREIDKDLFVDVLSIDRRIEDSVFFQRLLATLASVCGALALLLASIGLYGVMGRRAMRGLTAAVLVMSRVAPQVAARPTATLSSPCRHSCRC